MSPYFQPLKIFRGTLPLTMVLFFLTRILSSKSCHACIIVFSCNIISQSIKCIYLFSFFSSQAYENWFAKHKGVTNLPKLGLSHHQLFFVSFAHVIHPSFFTLMVLLVCFDLSLVLRQSFTFLQLCLLLLYFLVILCSSFPFSHIRNICSSITVP